MSGDGSKTRHTALGLERYSTCSNEDIIGKCVFRIKREHQIGRRMWGTARGSQLQNGSKNQQFSHNTPSFSFHSTACSTLQIAVVFFVVVPSVTVI
jgi:hypothetical protein